MKRIFLLLLGLFLCACGRYGCGVPAEYEPLLDAALADCPRADSLRQLLRETPRNRRAGMAFLVAYMPPTAHAPSIRGRARCPIRSS